MTAHKKLVPARLVRLSCGHERADRTPYPDVGDELLCPRCMAYSFVTTVAAEYRVRCRDCQTAHSYGVARMEAQHAASKHTRSKPGHRALVYLGDKLLEEREPAENSFETLADVPPF